MYVCFSTSNLTDISNSSDSSANYFQPLMHWTCQILNPCVLIKLDCTC